MKERFEGDNHPTLVESLMRHEFVGGNSDLAGEVASLGELVEFSQGERLIDAAGIDNDVYLLVAGSVSIVVNGVEIRTLGAGDHVGEMSAIDPAQPRSASVIAIGTVVALKVKGTVFVEICDRFPLRWKSIARELSRRLYDRNRLIPEPNDRPRLFIMSSVEALDIANEIASGLQHDVLPTVWTQGVFWPGGYPLEALENAVSRSDFGVAVAQFDDVVVVRGEKHPTFRDNVLFELGLFMGRLGRHRSILVHPRLPNLKLPSDLHGLTPAAYNSGKPEDLASNLGPVCHEIRKVIRRLGVRKLTA